MTRPTDAAPDLLPCPFCGAVAKVLDAHEIDEGTVGCDNADCPATPTVSDGFPEAHTAWNRRAAVNAYGPLREALAQTLGALEANQWGFNHRRCSLCGGYDPDPQSVGERDGVHTDTCVVAQAINKARALLSTEPTPTNNELAKVWRVEDRGIVADDPFRYGIVKDGEQTFTAAAILRYDAERIVALLSGNSSLGSGGEPTP